ncbi:MAG TPA: metalloregulator ArsR/SmtB family transcription factor [Flavobacteriales bacterium]|jgi:DNA-binding transcriptional ArsR family regulator|nr:metalloregulator ArsR/SmtB family transcription factor [Flavobacteriales bacterium]
MAKKKSIAEQELEDFDLVFKALGHRTRRNILVVLQARGGSLAVRHIVARFNLAWPTVTRHLQLLEAAGLVTQTRVSRELIYEFNGQRMKDVVANWMKWF